MKIFAGSLILKEQRFCRDNFYGIEAVKPAEVPVLAMVVLMHSPLFVNELGRIFAVPQ